MTIHTEHPFADPPERRDAARRLRARLGGQVSLWTTGPGTGSGPAGLTVSSMLVALGEPARVLGLLDPDSDLADRLTGHAAPPARLVVQLLEWRHRDLAEQFAGQMPAPGGPFGAAAWVESGAGPRLADATTWAECTVESTREVGWSLEVVARIDDAVVGEPDDPLLHRRGGYSRLGSGA